MKKVLFYLTVILLFLSLNIPGIAQIAINSDGSLPNGSAMVDVKSTTKGFLAPRMSMLERNAITKVAGLLIYQTDTTPGYYYCDGSLWFRIGSGWEITGNSGTNSGTNFIGTTDATSLILKTANTERMRITSSGAVGINATNTPSDPDGLFNVIGEKYYASFWGSPSMLNAYFLTTGTGSTSINNFPERALVVAVPYIPAENTLWRKAITAVVMNPSDNALLVSGSLGTDANNNSPAPHREFSGIGGLVSPTFSFPENARTYAGTFSNNRSGPEDYLVYSKGLAKNYFSGRVGIGTEYPTANLEILEGRIADIPTWGGPAQFSAAVKIQNTQTTSSTNNVIIGGQATVTPRFSGDYIYPGNSQGWNGEVSNPENVNLAWASGSLGSYKSSNATSRSWRGIAGNICEFDYPYGPPAGDKTIALSGYNLRTGTEDYGLYVDALKNYFSGKVGIGVNAPVEQLEVNGNVKATSFIATISGAGAYKYNTAVNMNVPDYVFDHYFDRSNRSNPEYNMLALEDLNIYVKTNKHLPGVPSREEITKAGTVNMQGLSMVTLEKVEENTLYVLELYKENQNLKKIIESQNKAMEEQKKLIEAIARKIGM